MIHASDIYLHSPISFSQSLLTTHSTLSHINVSIPATAPTTRSIYPAVTTVPVPVIVVAITLVFEPTVDPPVVVTCTTVLDVLDTMVLAVVIDLMTQVLAVGV